MLLINFLKVSGKVDFLVNGASEEMRTTKSGFSKVKDVSDLMSGDPVNEHLEQIEEKDNEKSIIKRVHIPGSNTYSRKRERQAIQMQNQRMYEKLQNAKPTVSNTDWSAHTARYQQLKRNIQGMRYKSPGKGGSLFPTFNSANLQAAQRHRDASVPRKRAYESLQEHSAVGDRLNHMRASQDVSGLSKHTNLTQPILDIQSKNEEEEEEETEEMKK